MPDEEWDDPDPTPPTAWQAVGVGCITLAITGLIAWVLGTLLVPSMTVPVLVALTLFITGIVCLGIGGDPNA